MTKRDRRKADTKQASEGEGDSPFLVVGKGFHLRVSRRGIYTRWGRCPAAVRHRRAEDSLGSPHPVNDNAAASVSFRTCEETSPPRFFDHKTAGTHAGGHRDPPLRWGCGCARKILRVLRTFGMHGLVFFISPNSSAVSDFFRNIFIYSQKSHSLFICDPFLGIKIKVS